MSTDAWLYEAFDTDPAPAVAFVRHVAERRGLGAGLRVLDVGAGTGRMVSPLRALGWEVTATEPAPAYRQRLVEVAREAGAAVTAEAFGGLDHEGAFDLALAVNGSFAHVLTPEARAEALRRLHRALRPGGAVFLDLPNFLWILRHYRPPEVQERARDGYRLRLRRLHEIDFHRATFTTVEEYEVEGGGGRRGTVRRRHAYAMTSPTDLEHLVAGAGFEAPEWYPGYASRAPERLDGPRMLLTARRPA